MAVKEITDVPEVVGEGSEAIARNLNGKVLHIVIVGSAGAGNSTLANTLLGRKAFAESHDVRAITEETAHEEIEVDLDGKGKATVVIYDTPGITGGRTNDKMVKEELRKIKTVDLLLICFSLDADGGRYLASKIDPVLDMVESIYRKEFLEEKAVLVLTKANIACKLIDEQAAKDKGTGKKPFTLEDLVERWKEEHKEEREGSMTANLPILIAGRLEMDEKTGKPRSIGKVANSTDWLDTMWQDICKFTSPELTTFLLLWRRLMLDDDEVSPAIKEAIKRWIISNKVKTALGVVTILGGAAILLPVVAAARFVATEVPIIAGVAGNIDVEVSVEEWFF